MVGSRFCVTFDDAKVTRRAGAEARVTWAPTLRTDDARQSNTLRTTYHKAKKPCRKKCSRAFSIQTRRELQVVEHVLAVEDGHAFQLILNAQQLVVLADAVGAAQ